VGAGDISHQQLVELSEKAFGSLTGSTQSGLEVRNSDEPYVTPSVMYMRDDEMANVNTGVFFNAPTWTDPDFFAATFFKELMGNYSADRYTGQHLNTPNRQYNTWHSKLGEFPDISIHRSDYFAYSDCALFGNYLHGNEVFQVQMAYMSQGHVTDMASYINISELYRARNKVYNDLLEEGNSDHNGKVIGKQISYLNRRVSRTEIAKRVSNLDCGILQNVATRWFWDRELAAVAWGPIHYLMVWGHYNRPMKRSTLGLYGSAAYLN